jgi:hypothetical protein
MTWIEALSALTGHPHACRYRALCADAHPDIEARDAYRALVVRRATGRPGPARAVPLGESLSLLAGLRACPFRSRDSGCGCAGARCALRGGAVVSHRDCFDCLKTYG